MKKAYRDLEDHIINLFNSADGFIYWNNKRYNRVAACKPHPQGGGGECKTDVYVLLNDDDNGATVEIKISVKKDDAEFLANKITETIAEDLLGQDWKQIIIKSIDSIKDNFINKKNELVFLKTKAGETDANFTLGWKLEVTNKPRTLSCPLNLKNDQIVKIIFKGENQVVKKKDAIIFNERIQENSGIAEYIIYGNLDKYSNAQEVINDLVDLNSYTAENIHLVFTANNFRYKANKADGARTLAIAVEWSVKGNRLSPKIIFDQPLLYQGERDMMPRIQQCLIQLGIKSYSDIDIESIKPNE